MVQAVNPSPPSPDVVAGLHGHGLDLTRIVSSAPAWGAWWDHHPAFALAAGGAGLGAYAVHRIVRHHRRGVKRHGSAWKHPWRTWRKAAWFRRKMAEHRVPNQPRVLGHNSFPAGDSFTVGLVNGTTADAWGKLAPSLAVAFAARKVVVEPVAHRADHALMHVLTEDPFEDPILSPLVALDDPFDFRHGVPVAVDIMGREVVLDLVGKNLLLGGIPGAGKTVLLRALVAAAALDPTVELALFDGKEGVGFRPWKDRARWYVADSEDMGAALAALNSIKRELDRRSRIMDEHGWDVWPCHKTGPGKGGPILIVIDEYAAFSVDCEKPLPSGAKPGPIFSRLTQAIVRKGRAAAMPVVLATQRPSVDIVPGSLRDLFAWSLALLCSRAAASDTILGQGEAARGWDASKLESAEPGIGWLKAEKGVPRLIRVYNLPREQAVALAGRAAACQRPSEVDERVPGNRANGQANGNPERVNGEPFARANGASSGPKEAGLDDERENGKKSGTNEREIGGDWGGFLSWLGSARGARDQLVLEALAGDALTLEQVRTLADPPIAEARARALVNRLGTHDLLEQPIRREAGQGNRSPYLYRASARGKEALEALGRRRGDAARETVQTP
jgi:DNA segregation ATPase FtsK/SpoIIIE, S-DNA-T family